MGLRELRRPPNPPNDLQLNNWQSNFWAADCWLGWLSIGQLEFGLVFIGLLEFQQRLIDSWTSSRRALATARPALGLGIFLLHNFHILNCIGWF